MPPRRTPTRPNPSTFVDLLERRASDQPDRLAYAYLVDGERQRVTLTHAELAARVNALAAQLVDRGAARERVLLLLPPGLDYVVAFWAVLAAGATAVPVYPPRAGRSARALEAIVADAEARFAVGKLPPKDRSAVGPLASVISISPDDGIAAAPETWTASADQTPRSGGPPVHQRIHRHARAAR